MLLTYYRRGSSLKAKDRWRCVPTSASHSQTTQYSLSFHTAFIQSHQCYPSGLWLHLHYFVSTKMASLGIVLTKRTSSNNVQIFKHTVIYRTLGATPSVINEDNKKQAPLEEWLVRWVKPVRVF